MSKNLLLSEELLEFLRSCVYTCDEMAVAKFGEDNRPRIVVVCETSKQTLALGNDDPSRCISMLRETVKTLLADLVYQKAGKN